MKLVDLKIACDAIDKPTNKFGNCLQVVGCGLIGLRLNWSYCLSQGHGGVNTSLEVLTSSPII